VKEREAGTPTPSVVGHAPQRIPSTWVRVSEATLSKHDTRRRYRAPSVSET
jgi:hypothetical protein